MSLIYKIIYKIETSIYLSYLMNQVDIYNHLFIGIYSEGYKHYDPAYYFLMNSDSLAYCRPTVIFVNPILIALRDTFLYSFHRELPIAVGYLTKT